MYSYSEVLAPSVVSNSAFWDTGDEKFLVLVRGNTLLQLYYHANSEVRLMAEFPLQGKVSLIKPFGDALLLAFKPAKLSIVTWCSLERKIKVRSLHYYENLEPGPFDSLTFEHSLDTNDAHDIFFRFQYSKAVVLSSKSVNSALELLNKVEASEILESQVFDIMGFISGVSQSTVHQIVMVPVYIEPTFAVLYSKKLEWVGFAASEGDFTKSIAIIGDIHMNCKVIKLIPDIPSEVVQVYPLPKDALLLGKTSLYILREYISLSKAINIESKDYNFANSKCVHINDTPLVLIVLNSGDVLVLDTSLLTLKQIPELKFANPSSISYDSTENHLLIASCGSGAQLLKVNVEKRHILSADKYEDTVIDTYKQFDTFEGYNLQVISTEASFFSPGSFSSITNVDGGLVATTDSGILLLHKYVPLIKIRTIRDIGEAKSWVWSDGSGNGEEEDNIIVLSSVNERTMCQREGRTHTIPGLREDMSVIASAVLREHLVIVQSEQIIVLSRDMKQHQICPTDRIFFAEIGEDVLLIHNENNWKQYNLKLELLGTYECDFLTAYGGLIVSAKGTHVKINAQYKMVDLPLIPVEDNHDTIPGVDDVGEKNSENTDRYNSTHSIISIQLMKFSNTVYLGIHSDHSYAIYEVRNNLPPLKVYTVQFVVNQSPIWLNDIQKLVFLGNDVHVVCKDELNPFRCLSLGLRAIDATSCGTSLVLVDPDTNLRFYSFAPDVDLLSANFATELFYLPEKVISGCVTYFDDLDSVFIGVTTREERYPKKDDNYIESDKMETNPEIKEADVDQEDPQMNEDVNDTQKETSSVVEHGSIFVLQLESLKLEKCLDLNDNEVILSIDCLTQEKRQLIAVGTAVKAVENSETNGYARVYKVKDEDGQINMLQLDAAFLRGPVSRVCDCMGYLIVSHSQQIHAYNVQKTMEPVSFYDSQVYAKDMRAIRNILIVSDREFGTRLIHLSLQPPQFYSLAHIPNDGQRIIPASSAAALSSASREELSIASIDINGLIHLYQFDPDSPESSGGSKLLPLQSFFSARSFSSFTSLVDKYDDVVSYGAAADGTVCLLSPLPEQDFRALHIVSQQVIDRGNSVLGTAGLNTRAFRALLTEQQSFATSLVDLDLARLFWSLPLDRQVFYAEKLGFDGLQRMRKAADNRSPLKL